MTVFLCSEIRPHFNPRPLAGATGHVDFTQLVVDISIHAPLRGRRFRMELISISA